ncbi:hypothetical protein MTO96_040178 [Rhipicephalus appendiculatus]
MTVAKSYFSGTCIINLIPCTSSEGRLCHIFREISLWNEYFLQVDLELRELSPGRLSLVEKHEAFVGAYANQDMPEQMHVVTTLLRHLLMSHHCVSSVAIVPSIFRDHHLLICDAALACSPSLKKVTVEQFRDVDVPEICRAVRESGAQDRFFIDTHYVHENTVNSLTESKELSSVDVQSHFFDRLEPLLTALSLLPSCSRLTSLRLVLWPDEFEGRVSTLIAQCITSLITLRKLKLTIARDGLGEAFNKARWELAQALSANKNIRKLKLYGPWFGEAEV